MKVDCVCMHANVCRVDENKLIFLNAHKLILKIIPKEAFQSVFEQGNNYIDLRGKALNCFKGQSTECIHFGVCLNKQMPLNSLSTL